MNLTHIRFQGTPREPRLPFPRRIVPAPVQEGAIAAASALPASVLAAAGLDPAAYRPAPLQRRAAACLRALREHGEPAAIERLRHDSSSAALALNTVLIGVSGFFRDPGVFETLRTSVIADFQRHARPIRVLSIGSSSGEELYSIALLLAEASVLERASLLGVDCRPDALRTARTGTFRKAALASMDPVLRSRYFRPVADGLQIIERVRAQSAWRVLDATRECPDGPWDLVLCRNLTIYLQPWIADTLFLRIRRALAPDGVLVVGKAERLSFDLSLQPIGRCVYEAAPYA